MPAAANSPEELAAWLRSARQRLRPAAGSGFAKWAVDQFLKDIQAKLGSERLDPYQIRAASFPVPFTVWPVAVYRREEVRKVIDELAERVERSPLVSTDAIADVPPAALGMANRIRNARFRTRRTGTGYDMREVDEFLTGIERALRRGEPISGPAIRARQFRAARAIVPRYVESDVRHFLEQVAQYADRGR